MVVKVVWKFGVRVKSSSFIKGILKCLKLKIEEIAIIFRNMEVKKRKLNEFKEAASTE